MYKNFAYIYDILMKDIDYKSFAIRLDDLIRKNYKDAKTIVDIGCGTGMITIELAKKNYEMIGIDISTDMLFIASEKAIKDKLDILFLNQDMREFELYGTVDVVISNIDSLNYILKKKELEKFFKLSHIYLNPEGLLIFDLNSEYKLKNILGDNTFHEIDDDITYIWQNTYDEINKICSFDLTFFQREKEKGKKEKEKGKDKDGEKEEYKYIRYEEYHKEKAYNIDEIKEMLEENGFTLLGLYDGISKKEVKESTKRIMYVSKKAKKV